MIESLVASFIFLAATSGIVSAIHYSQLAHQKAARYSLTKPELGTLFRAGITDPEAIDRIQADIELIFTTKPE